jgi:hypothetical protein
MQGTDQGMFHVHVWSPQIHRSRWGQELMGQLTMQISGARNETNRIQWQEVEHIRPNWGFSRQTKQCQSYINKSMLSTEMWCDLGVINKAQSYINKSMLSTEMWCDLGVINKAVLTAYSQRHSTHQYCRRKILDFALPEALNTGIATAIFCRWK